MKLQRVLNTVSVSLALGLVALAAWHVNHPETFHGSALLQVHTSTASVSLTAALFPWLGAAGNFHGNYRGLVLLLCELTT